MKKEAELSTYKEKIKRLENEIKVQKRRESERLRKKRTRNLIQFGVILTNDLGIDPLSDEDLKIVNAFLSDYVTFAYYSDLKQLKIHHDFDHKKRYSIYKRFFENSTQIPLLRKELNEQKKGG